MLFVSVLAEFNSTSNQNFVCVWDDIIWKEDAVIKLKRKRGEYRIHGMDDKIQYMVVYVGD